MTITQTTSTRTPDSNVYNVYLNNDGHGEWTLIQEDFPAVSAFEIAANLELRWNIEDDACVTARVKIVDNRSGLQFYFD